MSKNIYSKKYWKQEAKKFTHKGKLIDAKEVLKLPWEDNKQKVSKKEVVEDEIRENLIFGNKKAVKAVKDNTKNQNWTVQLMRSLNDAKIAIETIKSQNPNYKLNSVFLQSHGQENGLGLGGSNISIGLGAGGGQTEEVADYSLIDNRDLEKYIKHNSEGSAYFDYLVNELYWEVDKVEELKKRFKIIEIFESIINQIKTNGNLILGGCFVGRYLEGNKEFNIMTMIAKMLSYRINIYANRGVCIGAKTFVQEYPDGKVYTYEFLDFTRSHSSSPGWRVIKAKQNPNEDVTKLDNDIDGHLYLQSQGKPFIFK